MGVFVCGVGFLIIKLLEYFEKIGVGIIVDMNMFYFYYFFFMGIYFFYVIIGMFVLGYLIFKV